MIFIFIYYSFFFFYMNYNTIIYIISVLYILKYFDMLKEFFMKAIVIYKSKYGSTKAYAQKIAQCLGCEAVDAKSVKAKELADYDTIIYGAASMPR